MRVELTSGPAQATDDGLLIRARGLPYGSAERFAAPTPAARWTESFDATARGPACPQLPSRLEFLTGPVTAGLRHDENCQVVTVTAPSGAHGLPVMVWFHGGAYVSGSGEAPKYDPDALVTEGRVVVVTVSYRLGIFGYCPPLGPAEVNSGLQDQLLALRWVRDNITHFGGDPQRVTLFGQSAGGDSVLALLLAEAADGLYSRAIIQSAPLDLRYGRDAMTAAMRAAATETLAGVDSSTATAEQLFDAQRAAITVAQRFGGVGALAYGPQLGCDPLPPAAAAAARLAHVARKVELLVGSTALDAAPFVAMRPSAQRLRRLGSVADAATRVASRGLTRRVFESPVRRLARSWRANGGEASTYRLEWAPPAAPLGACHCLDVPLLLGAPGAWAGAPMLGPRSDAVPEALGRGMRRAWAAFAHDGVAALGREHLRFG